MVTRKQAFLMAPLVISVLIIIFGLLGYLIGKIFGLPTRLGLPLLVRVFGAIVLLAGFLLLAWVFSYRRPVDVLVSTFLTMRKAITGTLTKDKSARTEPLVIEGPHRYVRHPMYFAVVVLVLGWWLVLDYTFILLMAGLFILWFNLVVIRFEEQELRAVFGKQYESYSKSVPRFIPSFRHRREK
ncbi:MAG: isoprenylcysteine carboxylmethyltransferase family protein [Sedimentisphaerales bacterium]